MGLYAHDQDKAHALVFGDASVRDAAGLGTHRTAIGARQGSGTPASASTTGHSGTTHAAATTVACREADADGHRRQAEGVQGMLSQAMARLDPHRPAQDPVQMASRIGAPQVALSPIRPWRAATNKA